MLVPLIILSGASGSGKSTVIRHLLQRGRFPLRLAISATTRGPRKGEKDEVHYHFCSLKEFEQKIADDEFLEYAKVHHNYYGTLRNEVFPFLEQGIGVILDIDVQGAEQVRAKCPEHVSIFLTTSSMSVLEQRLRNRATEDSEVIERRLERAREEMKQAALYQHQVLNDDLQLAIESIENILQSHFPLAPQKES